MANWYGSARSNYVRVRDMDGLLAALEPFPIGVHTRENGLTCFLSEEADSGGWPSTAWVQRDEDEDEEIEFDPRVQIVPFLEDNEVLIMMEIGAEKLRYLTGNAVAFHPDGEKVLSVNIHDIYALVKNEWDVFATHAEY